MDTNHLRANLTMMKAMWAPPMTMESLCIQIERGQKVSILLNPIRYATLKKNLVDHLRASHAFDLDLWEYEASDHLKYSWGAFKIFLMEKDRLRMRSSTVQARYGAANYHEAVNFQAPLAPPPLAPTLYASIFDAGVYGQMMLSPALTEITTNSTMSALMTLLAVTMQLAENQVAMCAMIVNF